MSKLKTTNANGKPNFFRNLMTARKYRYGGFALLATAIVLAVAILVNVVLGVAEDSWALSIDLSPSKVTDFDEATYDTLADIDQDIVIYMLFQNATSSELRVQLESMAQKYHAINSHITYDFLDPYTEPTRLAKYVDTSTTSLAEGSVIVTLADDSKSRAIAYSDLYTYTYVEDSTSQYGFSYAQAFNGEAKLTSAIKYVASTDTPNVYFLNGHNEVPSSSCTVFAGYLQDENYNVADLTLGGDIVPGANDVIIVANPQVDMTEAEYEIMVNWLAAGGRLMMSMDNKPAMSELPNFMKMLELYQLSFGEGYVVEDSSATTSWTSSTMYVLPKLDAEHEITASMASSSHFLIIPAGRPINRCDIPLSGVQYQTLLTTSDKSFVKPMDSSTELSDNSDASAVGSQILAYAAMRQPDYEDASKDTRIVLLSSVYLFADTNILTSAYNLDFSMSVVEWLVNRDVSVFVRASAILTTDLEIADASTAWTIGIVTIAVIPLAAAIAGIVIWVRRRRL